MDETRDAGTDIDYDLDVADIEGVPAALGRDAYRIVQEGLTNVAKHAGDTTARVRVVGSPGEGLHVSVRNREGRRHPRGRPFPAPVRGCWGCASGLRSAAAPSCSARTVPATSWWRRSWRGSVKVLLVDDDALVRAGLRLILSAAEDIEVVGEADDGSDAVAAVGGTPSRHRPDGHPDAADGRHRGDRGASPARPTSARSSS